MAKITVECLRKIFTQLCIGEISEEKGVELLNEKASEPELINVKDELPNQGQNVMGDDRIETAYYNKITHWMPLPNKPFN